MVRFPNESLPIDIDFNMDDFQPEKDFGDEVFGYWNGFYISVKK